MACTKASRCQSIWSYAPLPFANPPAVFVTLTIEDELRGCIGTLESGLALAANVAHFCACRRIFRQSFSASDSDGIRFDSHPHFHLKPYGNRYFRIRVRSAPQNSPRDRWITSGRLQAAGPLFCHRFGRKFQIQAIFYAN